MSSQSFSQNYHKWGKRHHHHHHNYSMCLLIWEKKVFAVVNACFPVHDYDDGGWFLTDKDSGKFRINPCSLVGGWQSFSWSADPTSLWTDKDFGWGWFRGFLLFPPLAFFLVALGIIVCDCCSVSMRVLFCFLFYQFSVIFTDFRSSCAVPRPEDGRSAVVSRPDNARWDMDSADSAWRHQPPQYRGMCMDKVLWLG